MRSGTIAFVAALLIAGFLFGLFRRRWSEYRRDRGNAGRGRWAGIAIALVVAIPVGLILLAKLFDSNVLGWMFGLTLMLGFALLPCGAIFGVGFALGAFVDRRRHGPVASIAAPAVPVAPTLTVRIERDTVHASDEPASETLALAPNTTWLALLALVAARGFLPGISGGQATWVVERRGSTAAVTVGLCAQQWSAPRLLIADGVVAPLPGDAELRLYFRYLCQQDPDAVFACLRPLEECVADRKFAGR